MRIRARSVAVSAFTFLFICIPILGGCASRPLLNADLAPWKGKVYAGDPKDASITRKASGEFLSTSAKEFGDFVCLSYHDFADLYAGYASANPKAPNPPASQVLPARPTAPAKR